MCAGVHPLQGCCQGWVCSMSLHATLVASSPHFCFVSVAQLHCVLHGGSQFMMLMPSTRSVAKVMFLSDADANAIRTCHQNDMCITEGPIRLRTKELTRTHMQPLGNAS